jgi:hypothetical protein
MNIQCSQVINEEESYFIIEVGDSKIVFDEQSALELSILVEAFLDEVENFWNERI